MEKICTDVGDTKGKKHVDCDGIVEQVEKEKDKVENGEKVEKEKERQSGERKRKTKWSNTSWLHRHRRHTGARTRAVVCVDALGGALPLFRHSLSSEDRRDPPACLTRPTRNLQCSTRLLLHLLQILCIAPSYLLPQNVWLLPYHSLYNMLWRELNWKIEIIGTAKSLEHIEWKLSAGKAIININ